jgi:hypothetical protein
MDEHLVEEASLMASSMETNPIVVFTSYQHAFQYLLYITVRLTAVESQYGQPQNELHHTE